MFAPLPPLSDLNTAHKYWLIAAFYNFTGGSVENTSKMFNCCYNTVKAAVEWAKNPYELGKPGRNHIITPELLLYIEADTLVYRRKTSAQLAMEMSNIYEINISSRTVDRARHDLKFDFRKPIVTVQLTAAAKTKRINFCRFHIENCSHFRTTVFTDESYFQIVSNNTKLWMRPGEEGEDVRAPRTSHPPQLLVWGGIGWNFKTNLIILDDTIDSQAYINEVINPSQLMEDATRAFGTEWELMQDNVRPHISNYTINELRSKGITLLENWPPYSPDLNIIEVIWAVMKRRIEIRQPKSLQELRIMILEVWDALSYITINSLIDSMERRLHQVIRNNGETIIHLD
jgi:hypothetical protein